MKVILGGGKLDRTRKEFWGRGKKGQLKKRRGEKAVPRGTEVE